MTAKPRWRVALGLLCASGLLPAAARAGEGMAVLVPGTLNSAVPGTPHSAYFSAAILETVAAAGYETFVIKGLDPIGGLERNGEATLKSMRAEYLSRHPRKDAPITLLCHSAGGLYALYAAARSGDLPIARIIMVSAPLEGARLADYVLGSRGAAESLRRDLEPLPLTINLDGLKQLGTKGVAEFLAGIRLDPSVRLYAAAGSQRSPPNPLRAMDVEFLSPVFTITNRIIGRESDGIVERTSAYGSPVIMGTDGMPVPVRKLDRLHADLDHAEQLLDWRILEALGFYNAFLIEDRQRRFYSELLRASR
jgi:pimeloyl-ACP methyl ester carboxylesterase